MSDYRRLYVPGGTYFFTVVTYNRQRWFADEANVTLLREAFRYTLRRRLFLLSAIVVLPDHLHCIWTLPAGDADFSGRWQILKSCFSRRVPASTRREGSKTIWKPRFWEHLIRDEDDLHRHLDYIHYNPVKHGLAVAPGDWSHSSFGHFVRRGWYETDWGRAEPEKIVGMDLD
ncbi:MAG: transposase [Bacillota bacterium]